MARLLKEEKIFFANKKERDAYLYLERRKRDEMSHENYVLSEAKKEAKEEGKKDGIDERNREIAVAMLRDKKPIEEVIKYTQLPLDIVTNIKDSLSL